MTVTDLVSSVGVPGSQTRGMTETKPQFSLYCRTVEFPPDEQRGRTGLRWKEKSPWPQLRDATMVEGIF